MHGTTGHLLNTGWAVAVGLPAFWAVFTLFFAFTGSFRPRRRKTSR